ncbi:MAG: glycoside hydrolase family 10 protein [Synechocystis sp.]
MLKRLQFLKWPALIIGILAILGACHRAPSRTAIETAKMRGVWMTDAATLGLTYTTLLDETLNHISRSGYDRVYFSVYSLRGQLYPTKQRGSLIPNLPLLHPLRSMARESRRQGLKPYAWFEYGLMLPQSDPVAQKNPHWLLTMANGEQVIENHGIPMVWLDPSHPEVKAYILAHVDDILKEKSLAGIQLDDHWGVPRQFGNYQGALTALTHEVHQHIKAKNPDLVLSLSPNPYQFARSQYNQDWLSWVKQGVIDEVVVQVYRATPGEVQQTIAGSGIHTASRYVPVGVGLFTGFKAKPFTLQPIQEQIKTVENQGLGYALFVWEYLPLRYVAPHLATFRQK